MNLVVADTGPLLHFHEIGADCFISDDAAARTLGESLGDPRDGFDRNRM